MKNKLYILIDKNLDPIYGAVQGGHAVAQWLLEHWQINKEENPTWKWNNDYLIYLSVDINKWYDKLKKYNPSHFKWVYFTEPDLGNEITAIAVYTNDFPNSIIRKLKSEKLLSMEGR